ncbi:hypothetical protein AVV66_gp070 [Escherichia phage vB_EcoM_VR26]|uniref:DUF7290 domain-containing protein n=1 Tax=Escherichia phage vB_EcoM_VR26 TaxID=1567029 RepID=A0A0A7HD78_9CAUD|nr:hypothetical protein AVV66_gp070 [Escherichia phage vB_EcoM_VR26]AIZ02707.1 hypothetical protein VR26_070 [Escherichia phage vB_EcoM_VR26]
MSLKLHAMKNIITLNLDDERLIFLTIADKNIEIANGPKTYCCPIKNWKHVTFLSLGERLEDLKLDLGIKDIQYIKNLIDANC